VNLDDISNLVKRGETTTLEFKKSTANLKSACETICAFLNGDGGIVLIGVTDNGRLLGQEISDKTKREIGLELAKITPLPDVEIIYLTLPNTNTQIITFHVTTDSTKRPYLYDGRAYIRMESDTLPMPREYLQHLTMSNAQFSHRWEDQPQSNVSLDDLDIDEILTTINEGVLNGRIPEGYATQDPKRALQHLGLIANNQITHAAIILFGREPEKIFPQCLLRMARFRGIDKSEFIDNKQVYGNVFKLIRSALIFANTYLPIASVFPTGSIQREDIPLFPIVVLREATANAICHRDYSSPGGSISFAIYDDRLEIWNYGLLPPGISLTSITHLNQSIPRNRRIANVLYYHKLFESWGRGVQMIISECKKAGHPEPFYTQESGGTKLTLPSKQMIGSTTMIHKPTEPHPLTKRQQEILDLFKGHEELSVEEIHQHLKHPPSERWIRDELSRLKEFGYINYSGKTRSRKWSLVK
jgi:ATP-dependent DNA helicase RecG